jgi:hypothetical protein
VDPLILWTVRLATLFYVLALLRVHPKLSWTAGCLCFLAHVYAAFEFHHHWSHDSAHAETALQTAKLFGINSGNGIYFNYLFVMTWTADTAWWWINEKSRETRAKWISASIHGFMAFMFFNGVVVFANGPIRWIGLAATALILLLRLNLFTKRSR